MDILGVFILLGDMNGLMKTILVLLVEESDLKGGFRHAAPPSSS